MSRHQLLSILLPAAILLPTAPATAAGAHYRATFAQPVARDQLVVRELLWSCSGAACTASASNSRPAIVCATLAKAVGRLTAFSVAGVAFDTQALEKCNANAD